MRLRRVDPRGPGLRRIRRGRGYEYRDPTGRRVSDDAELARIRALAIPPAWTEVWICPHANGHIQATGVDEAGRTQYRYHEAWRARSDEVKFDRMLQLARVLPAARRSVTRDLRAGGTARSTVLAAAFRMLDVALLRVGSERYAQEHGSIGLSTLRCDHARVRGSVVSLRFPGKSGRPWSTEIDDADLAPVVAALRRRGPRARLLAWRDDEGWRPVRASDVNDDVHRRTGGAFTAKDFRTLHGTAIAAASLARSGAQETATARRRAMVAATREAAAALGNTPAVARASYIDPRLFERYEQGRTVDARSRRSVERQLVDLLAPTPGEARGAAA